MKLDHIVLNVSNTEESERFYGALLPMIGFMKKADLIWGNAQGLYIDIRPAARVPSFSQRFGPGVNHMGFTAPSRKTVDQIRGMMQSKGFEVPDVQVIAGDYCLFMKDADGFRIEITAYG